MLRKLLLAINDCAWAYSLTGKQYLFISPNISSVFGLNADEFAETTESWQALIIPGDKEQVITAINNLKIDENIELHYRIKVDGKIKWLFEKRSRFIDWADNTEIILSVIKDVTDQNAVKHHLANALGDFSVLFEKNKSPMWIYETPSLRILRVNQAAIDHYGYSNKEFLSMTIRDVRPKFDLAAFNEYIFRKGITERKVGYNNGGIWRHQNKSGEIIYAEITGHEMKYNNTTCRIIIANDVTERVRYEEERKKAENLANATP